MMFVTLFVGMLNTGNGELQFCNAAHNAPYRVRGSGVDAIQGAKGLALGIMDGANYENCHLSLDSPETIYLFTDGVTEATNEANVLFSEPRLEAVLRGVAREGCESLVQAVTDAIAGFVGSAPQADDITAMAVRWSGVKQ
jgi:sigma-B regulation protein RsbU (phosphoserine phosphatase)